MCAAEFGGRERSRSFSSGGGGVGDRLGRRRARAARAAQSVHRHARLPGEHCGGLLADGVAGALARHRHEHEGDRARQGVFCLPAFPPRYSCVCIPFCQVSGPIRCSISRPFPRPHPTPYLRFFHSSTYPPFCSLWLYDVTSDI